MVEIVNLRLARKRAARASREKQAEENRALHSVPARRRKAAAAERERLERQLDGNRRTGHDRPD